MVKGRIRTNKEQKIRKMKIITFQNVFTHGSVPESVSGEVAQTRDGRTWVYQYASSAVGQYYLASRPANVAGASSYVSSSTNERNQIVYVKVSNASYTVGAYQNCYLLVNGGTGSGQVAKIKDNTATTLQLYEDYALGTALSTDSTIAICLDNQVGPTPTTTIYTPVVGVAQVAFSQYDYGYFLRRGIGGVMVGAGSATLSKNVTPGGATAGYAILGVTAEGPFDATNVGRVLVANSGDAKAALVDVGAA